MTNLISVLFNVACELGQIMIRYDILEARRVIPTWPNFDFGQFCIWIEANNDQISLTRGEMSDFKQCSYRLQIDLISL